MAKHAARGKGGKFAKKVAVKPKATGAKQDRTTRSKYEVGDKRKLGGTVLEKIEGGWKVVSREEKARSPRAKKAAKAAEPAKPLTVEEAIEVGRAALESKLNRYKVVSACRLRLDEKAREKLGGAMGAKAREINAVMKIEGQKFGGIEVPGVTPKWLIGADGSVVEMTGASETNTTEEEICKQGKK